MFFILGACGLSFFFASGIEGIQGPSCFTDRSSTSKTKILISPVQTHGCTSEIGVPEHVRKLYRFAFGHKDQDFCIFLPKKIPTSYLIGILILAYYKPYSKPYIIPI